MTTKTNTVAPEQGSETTLPNATLKDKMDQIGKVISDELKELKYDQIRKAISADLKTARVVCIIAATDPDVANAIRVHLQKDVKNVPSVEHLQHDVLTSAQMLRMVLENDLIVDQIAETSHSLYENLREKQKLNSIT